MDTATQYVSSTSIVQDPRQTWADPSHLIQGNQNKLPIDYLLTGIDAKYLSVVRNKVKARWAS